MLSLIRKVSRHWATPDSYYRRIAAGALWVSIFVIGGKLVGAAKEMTVAWRYGVSETVDAYVFVFNIVLWPVSIWFSVLAVVLVPVVARVRSDSPIELPRFRGELLGLALLIGLVMYALVWAVLPAILRAGWLGLSGNVLQEALLVTSGLAILVPLGVVISLFSAWMLAYSRHQSTLLESTPAMMILVVVLLPSGLVSEPLVWGTVVGFVLHLAALAVPMVWRRELQFPRLTFASPAWKGFWSGFGLVATGQVLVGVTGLMDQFFAASLGPGAISTLSYASRVLMLVLGIGAMAIGRAVLPVFSDMQKENSGVCVTLALRWGKWMFWVGVGMLFLCWPLAELMVRLLFERGAFTPQETIQVSTIFQYSLLQVPFYMPLLVMTGFVASRQQYKIFLMTGVLSVVVKIITTLVLMPLIGLKGIVLSSALVYMTNTAMLAVAIKRKTK